MTLAQQYKARVAALGTQAEYAKLTGESLSQIERRCNGYTITLRAWKQLSSIDGKGVPE